MIAKILLWALAVTLIPAGLVGLLLPALPGAPLLFAGLLAAAWAEGFVYVGWRTLSVLALMAVLTSILDFIATVVGADRFGASKRGIIGAALGIAAGMFFGLLGVILGPFIGAVIGELTARRDLVTAGWAGLGATLGLALAAALKLAVAVSMLGIFLVVRFWGVL